MISKNTWEKREENRETAMIIRSMIKHKKELLKMDEWLPFPTNSCCYSFGENQKPIPIGALYILWTKSKEMRGTCPLCNSSIYGYAFGGLLVIGGIMGVCINCDMRFFKSIGNLSTVAETIDKHLSNTQFKIKTMSFGGCIEGPRKPLLHALIKIGEKELPSKDTINEYEPPGCFFTDEDGNIID